VIKVYFRYLDDNNDGKVSKKELAKNAPREVSLHLGGQERRRRDLASRVRDVRHEHRPDQEPALRPSAQTWGAPRPRRPPSHVVDDVELLALQGGDRQENPAHDEEDSADRRDGSEPAN